MKNPLLPFAAMLFGFFLAISPALVAKSYGSWEVTPHDATGAMLVKVNGTYRFHCTVENIKRDGNDMIASTARHCVYHDADDAGPFSDATPAGWDYEPIEVTYNDDEGGLAYEADPIAISTVDDLAIIRIKGAGNRALVQIGDSNKLEAGDDLVNYGYPLDLGKLRIDIKVMSPRILHFPDEFSGVPQWRQGFLVEGNINPGQSGSGVYDTHTHALVGILVGLTGNVLGVAEPSNRLTRLLDGKDSLAYAAPKLETK